MKKTRAQLEEIKSFVDSMYSNTTTPLIVEDDRKLDLTKPLGYCFKYLDKSTGNNAYRIVACPIGNPDFDFKVLIHEYGHIYFGHLDSSHKLLDERVADLLEYDRTELEEELNSSLGIDYAGKLIDRVIDDPSTNHSLHNIAMDMEINSKILCLSDIDEMEAEITKLHLAEMTGGKKLDKEIKEAMEKMKNNSMVKLIHPSRYHTPDGEPFPSGLQYYDYFLMIVQNLDQFVKMMVSIKNGGNGDTSQVSQEDLQKALSGQQGQGQGEGQEQGQGNCQGNGQPGDGNNGNGSGMSSLNDLMSSMGMTEDKPGTGSKKKDDPDNSRKDQYQGESGSGDKEGEEQGQSGEGTDEGTGTDHSNPGREQADVERKLGNIRNPGSQSCSKTGASDGVRTVNKTVDSLEIAINEIFKGYCKKVVRIKNRKDNLYLYNRGINRSVIAPTIKRRVTADLDPTIVYLIDISGSMDTQLVDRVLVTISKKMKKLSASLKYNIITWNTGLGEHIKDIKAGAVIPEISVGGGTSLAKGIKFFKDNYPKSATLVIISDFEDWLSEWREVESGMPGYTMFGLNYGRTISETFKNIKVRDCSY